MFRRHAGRDDPSLTEIDHVAIAVRDLEAAVAWYRDVLGATVVHREVVASDGVEEALVKVAESYVQLLTPTTRRLAGREVPRDAGEGLHHVAYRVDDCAAALEAVEALRRPRHRRGAAARLAGHDGRVRAPVGLVRHPDRARRGAPRLR